MNESYCSKCNYVFKFYKRIHEPEYCDCQDCMVDYLYTKSDGTDIFRHINPEIIKTREVDDDR